jgi:hypothetical protein
LVFGASDGVGFEGGGVGNSGGGFADGDMGAGVCCVQPTANTPRAMAASIDRLAFIFSLLYRLINRR